MLTFHTSYVDDMMNEDDSEFYSPPPFMCLIEEPKKTHPGDVSISMILICPSTGDVVWDDFEGRAIRYVCINLTEWDVKTRSCELSSRYIGTSLQGFCARN